MAETGNMASGALTRSQKAAAILVAMGKGAAGRLLKFFKPEELKALIEAARTLRTIPQAELEKIVAEFENEFAEGAGLLDSGDQMDTLINESLGVDEVQALMGRAAPAAGPEVPPVWPSLEQMEPARVGAMLSDEHPQTAAFILSNLSSRPAAAVLLTIDRKRRSEVVKRMLALSPVKPEARQLIENHIRVRMMQAASATDNSVGQIRVASLLNELDKSELDEMMGDLAAAGTSDLDAIRARLFAFEDIVLLSQKARVTLFDGLSSEVVTLALRGASPELTEAVLSALGSRSRRMIEAELGSGSEAPADQIVGARKTIASTALRLAGEGAIEIVQVDQAA